MPKTIHRYALLLSLLSLLGGCGGSSDSSSSQGSSFSLQLVTLQKDTLTNTNKNKCQVYYRIANSDSDGNAYYYYATKVSDPTVALYTANGTLSSKLTVDTTGKVTVYEKDIPANGYLGITTKTESQAITEYNVTAISSALLSAMTVSVASDETDGACISGTYSEASSTTGYMTVAIDDSQFTTAPAIYRIDNGDKVTTTASNTSMSMTAYSNSPVLVTAYAQYDSNTDTASDMMGYVYISASELCSKTTCGKSVQLIPLDQTGSIAFYHPAETDSAQLKLKEDSVVYNWQTLASDNTSYSYSDELADATWYYSATGNDANWTITRQQTITEPASGFDVDIVGDLDLSDSDPVISTSCVSATYACVIVNGIDSSQYNYQRTFVSAYDGTDKFIAMQVMGAASDEVVLPRAIDSEGNLIISANLLAQGSATVNLLSGSSSALFQQQRDDNLASAPYYYGTVLQTLASQQSITQSLAGANITNITRSNAG
ncbi:hypothetical protein KDN34_09435 [Shewanella yunxiaonensis]|uniref:Lipoprotein n=1 Tax=Shewanella yunxiaonensis TaxID=2829809 RepID=A0ABX7YQ57_9GAMM|nr:MULTISPECIES: hypothetical protein [Shewanella]MDF0536004.1 hypothetical protein [Shewanella sp. A32]QUN04504.1 hypothetical protein KDN34_09435 [Shewanella yunxiaonensis]